MDAGLVMTDFWSRSNERMELMEWAVAYEDVATRTVAIDYDPERDLMVSTIWEGMARPLWLTGDPYPRDHFETAVLRHGQIDHDLTLRSSSEQEALGVHAAYCRNYLEREPRPEDGYVEARIAADKKAREAKRDE